MMKANGSSNGRRIVPLTPPVVRAMEAGRQAVERKRKRNCKLAQQVVTYTHSSERRTLISH